jgi:DedD protein
MAFFKFRMSGQAASVEAVSASPNENIEVVRRRARHRLMGAVVLVLVAVVGFPLLFDTQPRPVAVDTPIVIPERQNTPPLASAAPVPSEQAPAKPLLSEPQAVSAQASLDAREEVVVSTPPAIAAAKPEPAKESPPAEKAAEKPVAAKQETKPAAPVKAEKPAPVAKPKDDGNKAQALLEGKTAKPSAGRVVIQVGAFSDAAKVRDVRNKLEQAGVKTYTQAVEKDGKNTTRIRVGPFETKEEADKAAARIRKLDLPVSFLKI